MHERYSPELILPTHTRSPTFSQISLFLDVLRADEVVHAAAMPRLPPQFNAGAAPLLPTLSAGSDVTARPTEGALRPYNDVDVGDMLSYGGGSDASAAGSLLSGAAASNPYWVAAPMRGAVGRCDAGGSVEATAAAAAASPGGATEGAGRGLEEFVLRIPSEGGDPMAAEPGSSTAAGAAASTVKADALPLPFLVPPPPPATSADWGLDGIVLSPAGESYSN